MGIKSVKDIGMNKKIPIKYETSILAALSYFPELKYVHIEFFLKNRHPVPYGTLPTLGSFIKPPSQRTYRISILEEADEPEYSALFRNLTHEMRVAVIAHELIHVLQFHKCTALELLKTAFLYSLPIYKRKIEREADYGAIRHGLGEGLHKHAVYIRTIPGYVKKRPGINKYYLHPEEIVEFINQQTFNYIPKYNWKVNH